MGNLLRQLFFYLFGEELVANNEKLPLEVDRNHRVLAEDDYREIATRIINGYRLKKLIFIKNLYYFLIFKLD